MSRPQANLFLFTDSDLSLLLEEFLSLYSTTACFEWEKIELANIKAEKARREKLGRNSLIQEFRKKVNKSS
jgi:hypothetical protein